MAVKLSVVIPTVGRPTLDAAVKSCAGADEVIVVKDATGDHGYTARTNGIRQATGTHLAFMDDDDVYNPGAIELMRQHASDRPVIFRMDHHSHGIIWRNPALEFGNVSTQMFLVPNRPSQLGVWAPHIPGLKEPGGDFTFIRGCADRMGEPVWRDEVIATIRPAERGPSLAVVTPWLNHPELAEDYWKAIRAAGQLEVIVVDNASDPPINGALRMPRNLGFSAACNVGLRAAKSDAVLFLNNDIMATGTGWDAPIRAAVQPGVLVGANLRFDVHGSVDGQPLPYLDGWCLAGMRDDLLELGGFDEDYQEPAYYSDNDLCLRARAAGVTLREVRVPLVHKENQTAGPAFTPAVRAASLANRERFAALARDLMAVAA